MGAELVIRRSSIPVYRENFAVVIVSYIEQGIDEIGKFNCVRNDLFNFGIVLHGFLLVALL